MSLICKKCGSNIPEGSNFCPECGAKFEADTEQKPKCAYCGAELKETSKFCPACGMAVSEPSAAEEKAAAAAPVCAYCGGEIKTTSKFCPHCGKTVGAPAANVAPTAQSETISRMQQQAAQRGIKVAAPINDTADGARQQPPYPPQYQTQNRQSTAKKRVKPLAVILPVVAVVLIAAILFTGLVAPGWMHSSGKPGDIISLYDDDSYVQLVLPKQTEEQRFAYTAANTTLQAYMNARLLTEKMGRDAENGVDPDDLAETVRAAAEAWDIADRMATVTGFMGAQLSAVEDTPAYRKALSMVEFGADGSFILKAGAAINEDPETDPKKWAEEIRSYYNQAKDGKKVRQMASILKTDAKTAMEAIQAAESILSGDYKKDEKLYTWAINTCKVVKTASKCTAFGLAVVSSGGVAAALSSGALAAGATIGSGVDCLVDVADTGMTVVLGEDHETAVAFQDVKSKLAPVTATAGAVGLFTGNWSKIEEIPAQLHYIQDSFNDLKNDGKLLGFQLFKDDKGNWNNKFMKLVFDSDISYGDLPDEIEKKYAAALKDMEVKSVDEEKIKQALTAPFPAEEQPSLITELENMALDKIEELIDTVDVVTDSSLWMEQFENLFDSFEQQMEKLDYGTFTEDDLRGFEDEFFIDQEIDENYWSNLFLPYEDMAHEGDDEGFDNPDKWVKPDIPSIDSGSDNSPSSSDAKDDEDEPVDSSLPTGVEIDDSDSVYQVVGTYVGTKKQVQKYTDMEDETVISDTYYAIRYDGEQLYLVYPYTRTSNYNRRVIPIAFNSIAMTGSAYVNDPDIGPEDYSFSFKVVNGQMKFSMNLTNYWGGDGDYAVDIDTFEGVKVSNDPEYMPPQATKDDPFWNRR